MKLVSICIAAYNAEKYIKDAISSVLNQTYNNIEVIICNDRSTDRTLKIINSFESDKVKVLQNTENLGYLKTFNKLLSKANGEYISFLDADDFVDKEKVQQQVDFLEKNQNVFLVGTGVNRTDEIGKVIGTDIFPLSNILIKEHLLNNVEVCFCGSSVMIRKEVIETIGGYREYFNGCPSEDYDWIRRINEVYDCANLEDKLYYYRFAEESLTKNVHYNIKARHSAELAQFFSQQRSTYGLDSLMNEKLKGLSIFIHKIEERYKNSPGLLYRQTSFEHAINGDYNKAISDLLTSFKKERAYRAFFRTLLMVSLVIIFPESLLLKLKNIFKIKNISKSL